eukprot:3451597-Rhodomonas_salina.1
MASTAEPGAYLASYSTLGRGTERGYGGTSRRAQGVYPVSGTCMSYVRDLHVVCTGLTYAMSGTSICDVAVDCEGTSLPTIYAMPGTHIRCVRYSHTLCLVLTYAMSPRTA